MSIPITIPKLPLYYTIHHLNDTSKDMRRYRILSFVSEK